jgi:hypothetical protein
MGRDCAVTLECGCVLRYAKIATNTELDLPPEFVPDEHGCAPADYLDDAQLQEFIQGCTGVRARNVSTTSLHWSEHSDGHETETNYVVLSIVSVSTIGVDGIVTFPAFVPTAAQVATLRTAANKLTGADADGLVVQWIATAEPW